MKNDKLDLKTRQKIYHSYVALCACGLKIYKTAGLSDNSAYHYTFDAIASWIKSIQMDFVETPEILYLVRINDVHRRILEKKFPDAPSQDEAKIFAERIDFACNNFAEEMSESVSALYDVVTQGKLPTKLLTRAQQEIAQEAADMRELEHKVVRKFKIPERCDITVVERETNYFAPKTKNHIKSCYRKYTSIKQQNIRRVYNTRHK